MSMLTKKAHDDNSTWDKQKDLIKTTICKGSTDDELELFINVCKRTRLDPFMKQIYPVKRWDSREKKEVMSIQTSIDGFRIIAERTGRYSPGKEPVYAHKGDSLVSCTAYVKKMTADGTWHEVAATAFYDEYVQKTKEGKVTTFWDRMPRVMLAKCAESMALRRAFPAELSGMYTGDEMNNSIAKVEPEVVVEEPKEAINVDMLEINRLLQDHISIPSVECLDDYLKDVKQFADKMEKDMKEIVDRWLDDPHKFLDAYNKWLSKRNALAAEKEVSLHS